MPEQGMSASIHTFAQRRDEDSGDWIDLDFKPFDWSDYGMFGLLANVRNHSVVPVISAPRGWPGDFWGERPLFDIYGHKRGSKHYEDPYGGGDAGYYSKTWFTMADLLEFDYDQTFEDRRFGTQTVPAGTPGQRVVSVREYLSPAFFDDLQTLVRLDCERVMVVFS